MTEPVNASRVPRRTAGEHRAAFAEGGVIIDGFLRLSRDSFYPWKPRGFPASDGTKQRSPPDEPLPAQERATNEDIRASLQNLDVQVLRRVRGIQCALSLQQSLTGSSVPMNVGPGGLIVEDSR